MRHGLSDPADPPRTEKEYPEDGSCGVTIGYEREKARQPAATWAAWSAQYGVRCPHARTHSGWRRRRIMDPSQRCDRTAAHAIGRRGAPHRGGHQVADDRDEQRSARIPARSQKSGGGVAKQTADDEFVSAIETLRQQVSGQPGLIRQLAAIRKFDDDELNRLENETLDLIRTDAAAGAAFYATSYLPTRRRQEAMVISLEQQVNAYRDSIEAELADQRRSELGYSLTALVVTLLLASMVVWRLGIRISRPFSETSDVLDRLAARDYSVRITGMEEAGEIARMRDLPSPCASPCWRLTGLRTLVQPSTPSSRLAPRA